MRFGGRVLLMLLAMQAAAPAFAQAPATNGVIDKAQALTARAWLDNRDEDWYRANAPFLDTPDQTIDDTWYYRLGLMTEHMVYGSPKDGYSVTEFIDRPGWSGTYGAISCPLGLQFADLRWLREQRVARDYARYWMHVDGAQPRAYTNWFGDAMWGLYKAWGDKRFIVSMLPDMKTQYAGWEAEHWDKRYGMFVWDGMHDGMETNINSRQTDNWFSGAEGVRPTFSSYMFADARAIAATAALAGDRATATEFAGKAAALKKGVQDMLWDKERRFFFHMFANDEKLADKQPGSIKAGTLTYRSGPHAGDPHGRELIGLVPWQFGLPDPGYEEAWKGIKDPDVFAAAFGPTVTERHDPLFKKTENCCTWSGNSWPFATAQTLEAMANLLNDYRQSYVDANDYYKLLRIFSLTQRRDGVPFVAEAADPDTGAWQVVPGHSEHYFHSSYVDLVVTGLAGLRPRADDRLVVNPLIPRGWNWFALDDVPYHGHLVSIVWDRDGTHYGRGKGLSLIVDGRVVAQAATLGRIEARLGAARPAATPDTAVNFAVNNASSFFPRFTASAGNPDTPIQNLNDGVHWYLKAPANRWTTEGASTAISALTLDFGIDRPVESLRLYMLDDGAGAPVQAPRGLRVDYATATGGWRPAPLAGAMPPLAGHRATELRFAQPLAARRFRLTFTAKPGAAVGLSEVEAWGHAALPLPAPTARIDDLAYNSSGKGFPKASASFTSPFDRIEEINDGKAFFSINSRNRWTASKSPNTTDWVAIDMGIPKSVGRLDVEYWRDNGDVRAPTRAVPQYWTGTTWRDFAVLSRTPATPRAPGTQVFVVRRVTTRRVRLVMDHDGNGRTGITELMLRSR